MTAVCDAGLLYMTQILNASLSPKLESGSIVRCKADGSQMEQLLKVVTQPLNIALHPPSGSMYWTDYEENALVAACVQCSEVV